MRNTKRQKTESAILYARVSTKDQAGEDHFSIPAQIQEMEAFVQRKGWKVVGVFVDEGISGRRRERPGLDQALEVVRQRGCDYFVVHELSRLARSIIVTLDILGELGAYGVGFASVKEPEFDLSTMNGRLLLNILASINQYYVDQLSFHTKKGKKQRARSGLYNFSTVPYGYRKAEDPHQPPVIDEREAQAVRMAFEHCATGRYTDREIADLLMASGFKRRPSKRHPEGAPFTKDNVATMLRNKFYMGMVVYRPTQEVFEGKHQPIVEAALWHRCQEARAARKAASRAMQKAYRVYLLSLRARCDVCGRQLRSQHTRTGEYYREVSAYLGERDCPHQSRGVHTHIVDAQIHEIIKAIHLPDDWLEEARQQIGSNEELERIQRQRAQLLARKKRLRELYLRGDFEDDTESYTQELNRIKRELARLPDENQLQTLQEISATVQDLPEVWAAATKEEQRDLLRAMVTQVDVDVPQGRVVAVRPNAAFLPIFRHIPLLQEREFGLFVPVWPVKTHNGKPDASPSPAPVAPMVSEPMAEAAAPPFLLENVLRPATPQARMAPGVAQALKWASASKGTKALRLQQVIFDGMQPLPADTRKWPGASAETLTMASAGQPPTETADVLVVLYPFWRQFMGKEGFTLAESIRQWRSVLAPGSVLYVQALLPLDAPAHWVYQVFPEAWHWLKPRAWGLYHLYNAFRALDWVNLEVKRHVFIQPVAANTALAVARQPHPFWGKLPAKVYAQGLAALEAHGAAVLSSEVAVAE